MIHKYAQISTFAICLGVGSLGFSPIMKAQAPQSQEQTPQKDQKSDIMVGKVIKTKSGRFALLTDAQNGKGVYLDDEKKAGQFEGKNVKVTGQLDTASNTMRVSAIEEV